MSVVTWPDQLTILTRWPRLHSHHQPHPPPTPAAHFRPGQILKLLDRHKVCPDRAWHCCAVGLVLFRKTQINSPDVIGDHPLVLAWARDPGPSSLLRLSWASILKPQLVNSHRPRPVPSVSDHHRGGKFQATSSNWHPQMISLSANRFH